MKTISQNPDRYSKQGANWVISASPDIKPIYLPIGVSLTNLKPVIKANGIIVKVGESYLCSITTLNEIKQSNNPHYDIVENGKIKVKDKEVVIGKTIKIIELNTTKLEELVNSRNFMNLQSGVTTIEYTNDERELVEGVPKKLIEQINYTLDKDSERPKDKFEVVDYFKMVDKKVNPHYTIAPIRTITDQQETIFDPKRLQTFIIELSAQLALLRRDFNTIQATFFDGIIPTPNVYGIIQEDILAQTDTDDLNTNHSNRRTDSSVVIAVEPTPIQTVADDASLANQPPIVPPTNLPTIEQWRLRRKRDGDKNGMGIYPTVNFKNFNLAKNKKADKRAGIIREGETFTGYKFKTFDNTRSVWAIQSTPDATPTGYAYQGKGDDVDKA